MSKAQLRAQSCALVDAYLATGATVTRAPMSRARPRALRITRNPMSASWVRAGVRRPVA